MMDLDELFYRYEDSPLGLLIPLAVVAGSGLLIYGVAGLVALAFRSWA
jgi:hypothetical protein